MWPRLLVALNLAAYAAAAVTGQAICHSWVCIKALRENGTDTYTATPIRDIPLDTFGWIAVGFGELMPNSPLVVMWPNRDGTFTLSQRQASEHVMPSVVENPPRRATLDTTASWSNSTSTSMTFHIPSDNQNMTGVLFAMGKMNPGASSPYTSLQQHVWSGGVALFLDAPYTEGELTPFTGLAGTSNKANKADGSPSFALIAHIVCGVLVTMLVLPGGVVLPRITRGLTTSRWWFYFHAFNQGFFAVALVITAFGLAVGNFGGWIDSRHRKCGCTLMVLVALQLFLGLFAHFYVPSARTAKWTFQTKRGRGPTNFLHVALGIIVVAVGWATCWTGFTHEWIVRGLGRTPFGLRIGWGIVVLIWLALYIFGIAFMLPRQLRIESDERATLVSDERKTFRSSAVALAQEFHIEQSSMYNFNHSVENMSSSIALAPTALSPTPPPPSLYSSAFSAPSPRSPDMSSFGGSHSGHEHGQEPNHFSEYSARTADAWDRDAREAQDLRDARAAIVSPPIPNRPEGADGNPFRDESPLVQSLRLSMLPPNSPRRR